MYTGMHRDCKLPPHVYVDAYVINASGTVYVFNIHHMICIHMLAYVHTQRRNSILYSHTCVCVCVYVCVCVCVLMCAHTNT